MSVSSALATKCTTNCLTKPFSWTSLIHCELPYSSIDFRSLAEDTLGCQTHDRTLNSLIPWTSVVDPSIARETEVFFLASLQALVFGCHHNRSLAKSLNTFLPWLNLHASVAELLNESLNELWPNSNRSVLHFNTSFQYSIFNSWFGYLELFLSLEVFINLIPLMMNGLHGCA